MEQMGHEVKIAYARDEVPEKYQKYAVKIKVDARAFCVNVKHRSLARTSDLYYVKVALYRAELRLQKNRSIFTSLL